MHFLPNATKQLALILVTRLLPGTMAPET
jgi:hypothetical protein